MSTYTLPLNERTVTRRFLLSSNWVLPSLSFFAFFTGVRCEHTKPNLIDCTQPKIETRQQLNLDKIKTYWNWKKMYLHRLVQSRCLMTIRERPSFSAFFQTLIKFLNTIKFVRRWIFFKYFVEKHWKLTNKTVEWRN